MSTEFDVVVIGGGPAGCSTAIWLAREACSVALIERSEYEQWRVGETLPPAIRPLLDQLGASKRVAECPQLHSYVLKSAWESSRVSEQDFVFNPYGSGLHVDRASFDRTLAELAEACGVRVWRSTRFAEAIALPRGAWQVRGRRNGAAVALTARIIVDATGRQATVAKRLGAKARVEDRLVGVVAVLADRQPSPWTLIEAVADGWWYSAALPGGRAVAAFMTDSDIWAKVRHRADCWNDFLRRAPHTWERFGNARPVSEVRVTPASSVLRKPLGAANWIAAGDAAASHDPLSGQGVYSALGSGRLAASAILRALNDDAAAIGEYERSVTDTYSHYLELRTRFYGSVHRWPESPFWERRSANRSIPAGKIA